mmetsp:Transcript_5733/g.7651  ORF Transcript_5733/g.7651 Transcript_5733/m.7651 type:complete len:107 (-) Transcript_5733:47-367(-)
MARSRGSLTVLFAFVVAAYLSAPAFVSGPTTQAVEIDATRVAPAAIAVTGAMPLALSQPAVAYDSVVSYLQAWLFGGTFLVIFFVLVLVASIANPLTLRREEAERI